MKPDTLPNSRWEAFPEVYPAQSALRRLNHVAPQIQAEIIPRAGHDLWIVQAGLVNEKLLGFLGDPATPMVD